MAETETLADIKIMLDHIKERSEFDKEIELLHMLRKLIRTRGGNVQKVLGND